MKVKIICIVSFFSFLFSCNKESIIIDEGDGITIEFLEGLNDDPQFQLSRNSNGYYEMILDRDKNQTIQRISGRLLRNGIPVEDKWSGPGSKKVEFSSNLYWWLLEGETVANITYTYLNLLTGELVYVNLPPLVNWRDVLVPTVNESGYTDSQTGVFNTVIAPIKEMVGDTMKVKVEYIHSITSQEEGSKFFETLGKKVFRDSVYIVLK